MDRSRKPMRVGFALIFSLILLGGMVLPALAGQPVRGAVFTTTAECVKVNGNIYDTVFDVFIDGGPKKPGAAGLSDGFYYVQVTQPNGKLLGTSVGSANETPVEVVDGEFTQCLNLYEILVKASDGSQGYDNTGNKGGEYKLWVSTKSTFANNSSKTDNFKVKPGPVIGPQ